MPKQNTCCAEFRHLAQDIFKKDMICVKISYKYIGATICRFIGYWFCQRKLIVDNY